jgi:hypothetical protein
VQRLSPVLSALVLTAAARSEPAPPVSYNFAVRPLLSSKCFACHGSDANARKADLRLDLRDNAIAASAIVPGNPASSQLIERIRHSDPDEVMPPPEKHAALSPDEISLLERWISQGAPYEKHWAFITPQSPPIPSPLKDEHPIDSLIRAAATSRNLPLAPPASPSDWLRRTSFAVTGLPPEPAAAAAFVANPSPAARSAFVDQLLNSPAFGERMATDWLDAARYADTYGRHEDADSTVWPWRDWVIRAFNQNLPYNDFIKWQLAGDLLPNPSNDQILATAFQRLPVQSNESGSDPEEYRWDQVFDRVHTTSSAFMGLTFECARCHDHKYDPFSAKDYYQFAAYLNNIDELGLFARYSNGIPSPATFAYKDQQQETHQSLLSAITAAEQHLAATRAAAKPRFTAWLAANSPPGSPDGLWNALTSPSARRPHSLPAPSTHVSFDLLDPRDRRLIADSKPDVLTDTSITGTAHREGRFGWCATFPRKITLPSTGHVSRSQPFSLSFWLKIPSPPDRGVILHHSRAGLDAANRGYEITFENGKLTATLAHFYPGNALRIQLKDSPDLSNWHHVGFSYDGSSRASGMSLFLDGIPQPVSIIRDNLTRDIAYLDAWGDLDSMRVADADYADPVTLTLGARTLDASLRSGAIDDLRFYSAHLSTAEMSLLAGNPPADDHWFDWFLREIDADYRAALTKLAEARRAENDFTIPLTEVMVMRESQGPRRSTPILNRGDFRQPGELVQPGVPSVLLPLPTDSAPNRLGLASWLTHPDHPLTARVAVNRIWSAFFGAGLVPTPEDFGLQGRPPALPELLDWLATHFIKSGWNVKALCREIALSQTFARSSAISPDSLARDPSNQFLARGPRFRLPAEQLRDAALAASGLLVPTIGGPSVKPWQPEGLWEESGTQHTYTPDSGPSLHRRSLYTFWRRTCPPPLLNVFDAPTREFCKVRRESTLTPLQSLAFQNDTGIVETARVLAEQFLTSSPTPPDAAALPAAAWSRLTSGKPSPTQQSALASLFSDSLLHYKAHPDQAAALLKSTGTTPLNKNLDPPTVAAALVTIRAILNSDAFLASY